MPRIAKNVETCRLNLEMAVSVRKTLERLRDETNADSLAEVIRHAINLYQFVHQQKKDGNPITLGKDGREIVFL